jgi:hypothetical protein
MMLNNSVMNNHNNDKIRNNTIVINKKNKNKPQYTNKCIIYEKQCPKNLKACLSWKL